jgi:hypothetical protein
MSLREMTPLFISDFIKLGIIDELYQVLIIFFIIYKVKFDCGNRLLHAFKQYMSLLMTELGMIDTKNYSFHKRHH